MCCDSDSGVKKPIKALCVWLMEIDCRAENLPSECHYIRHPAEIVIQRLHLSISLEKCRILPLWWITNHGWCISVVTNTWTGFWQLQQLQQRLFNLLSAHGNIFNCHSLNLLMKVRSFLSILWKTQCIHHFTTESVVPNVTKMCSVHSLRRYKHVKRILNQKS